MKGGEEVAGSGRSPAPCLDRVIGCIGGMGSDPLTTTAGAVRAELGGSSGQPPLRRGPVLDR